MFLSADGGALVDLNRTMPGDEAKGSNGARFDGRIWNRLWAGNVDLVIDMHTQSTGTAYPLYVWADVRLDGVQKIAEALNPDVIKYDPGEKGTVETEFDRVKIPAVTFELGRAKAWQHDLILRAVSGIGRVMVAFDMLAPPAASAATLPKPFIGNETTSINASAGGFVELHVALLDKVTKGQPLATQMNPFGAVVKEYTAPEDGLVLAISDEPTREPGALIVRLIHWNKSDACKQGC
jgi:predicted deacylase